MALPTLQDLDLERVMQARRAFAQTTRQDALDELTADAQELEVRRIRRATRRLVRATPQCSGCRRLLTSRSGECPGCGFMEGRGYRP